MSPTNAARITWSKPSKCHCPKSPMSIHARARANTHRDLFMRKYMQTGRCTCARTCKLKCTRGGQAAGHLSHVLSVGAHQGEIHAALEKIVRTGDIPRTHAESVTHPCPLAGAPRHMFELRRVPLQARWVEGRGGWGCDARQWRSQRTEKGGNSRGRFSGTHHSAPRSGREFSIDAASGRISRIASSR